MLSGRCLEAGCGCYAGSFNPFPPNYSLTRCISHPCKKCHHGVGSHEGGEEWAAGEMAGRGTSNIMQMKGSAATSTGFPPPGQCYILSIHSAMLIPVYRALYQVSARKAGSLGQNPSPEDRFPIHSGYAGHRQDCASESTRYGLTGRGIYCSLCCVLDPTRC
jgi:hypothetical protein